MKIRIESDGVNHKIFNAVTGEDLSDAVTGVDLRLEYGTATASVEFVDTGVFIESVEAVGDEIEVDKKKYTVTGWSNGPSELKWGTDYTSKSYGVPQPMPRTGFLEKKKPVRIGFVGKMGSGKSTLAQAVMAEYAAEKLSFAKPVKEVLELVNRAINTATNHMDLMAHVQTLLPDKGYEKQDLLMGMWLVDCLTPGLTKRERLQRIGTDSGRSIDKDIWVRHGIKQIEEGKSYVVDDVRFVNEAEALKKQGFLIVRLTAPDTVRRNRIIVRDKLSTFANPLSGNSHPSETEQDEIIADHTFNTSEVDELQCRQRINSIVRSR